MAESAFYNNWKNSGLPASGGVVSNSNASGAYGGFKGGTTSGNAATDPYAVEALGMSPAQRLALSKLLKAAGYIKTATSKYNKALGEAYSTAANDLAVEAAKTGRPQLTLKQFLVENPVTPSGTGSGTSNLPSRQVYQYKEADRQKWIDDVSQNLRGQSITEEDKKAQWYKDLQQSIDNMIKTGTVTTTSKVKNAKGVLENKSVTVPGFSQDAATTAAEAAIRKATPEDVARQERVGFTSWMFGQLGGANG